MNIEEMPAGPEIDKLVGKRIMGRKGKFSSDIAAAWKVLEKIYESTGHGKIRLMKWDHWKKAGWTAPVGCQFGDGQKFVCAETPALAICRAALKAAERRDK